MALARKAVTTKRRMAAGPAVTHTVNGCVGGGTCRREGKSKAPAIAGALLVIEAI